MSEAWIDRVKHRRRMMKRVLRNSKSSHNFKIELLEEQKIALQRWLRLWPLRYLLDTNVLTEVPHAKDHIQRIDAKIEKVRQSKLRMEKWEAANPDHPFRRRKRI